MPANTDYNPKYVIQYSHAQIIITRNLKLMHDFIHKSVDYGCYSDNLVPDDPFLPRYAFLKSYIYMAFFLVDMRYFH